MDIFSSKIEIFTKNNSLIIEDYPIIQKINYQSIDNVLKLPTRNINNLYVFPIHLKFHVSQLLLQRGKEMELTG